MNLETIRKFSDSFDIEELAGGQNTSVRAGNLAIKPISDTEKYVWLATELDLIADISFARPVKSLAGNWLEGGHGATQFFRSAFEKGRIREKLAAAATFHRASASIAKPALFDQWSSPWSLASRVAWNELLLPENTHSSSAKTITALLAQYRPLMLGSQFIHSDLAGNLLFDGDKPVIIDISPDFRPVEYAATLLVTDSIAWHDEPLTSLDLLDYPVAQKTQLILRAVVFRLCVPIFFEPSNHAWFQTVLGEFKTVLGKIGV